MAPTTDREIAPFGTRSNRRQHLQDLQSHGLAAYLVAGPSLERKMATQRHAPGEARFPEGAAVVSAAVDWSRVGRTDAISRNTLLELWKAYLPPSVPPSEATFERGLEWAMRPLTGTIALLNPAVQYQANDLVVQLTATGSPRPRDQAWAAALADVTDGALAVGASAFNHEPDGCGERIPTSTGLIGASHVCERELQRWQIPRTAREVGRGGRSLPGLAETDGTPPTKVCDSSWRYSMVNLGVALGGSRPLRRRAGSAVGRCPAIRS